jgi:hypothetical protein
MNPERLPRDLAALDAELRATRAAPRASLGAEIAGRAARGERPRGPGPRTALVTGLLLLCGALYIGAGVKHVTDYAATRDLCCGNLTGGARDDDGVVVTTDWRGEIRRLVVYEDRDGSRSLSVGDVMHLDSPSVLQADPRLAQAFTARTQCCSDFDGEGLDDDGVLVGVNDGKVVMATVFDSRHPDRNRRIRRP